MARYDGSGEAADEALAITVDDDANVYVTGCSASDADPERSEIATLKYGPTGEKLWLAVHGGPASAVGVDLGVDRGGNVYVAGSSGDNAVLIKYSPAGEEIWVRQHDGPGRGRDFFADLAVDLEGFVYVTGVSSGSDVVEGFADRDYITSKYDSAGNLLWEARFDGSLQNSDEATSLGVDSRGNVYVTGSSGAGWDLDYVTVKYDSEGQEVWVASYDGPDENGRDAAAKLVLEDDATLEGIRRRGRRVVMNAAEPPGEGAAEGSPGLYVTGFSFGPETKSDWATLKYDSETGDEVWEARVDGNVKSYDEARDIALDAKGNVYVAGRISACSSGRCVGNQRRGDYGLVKYDPDGAELWSVKYDERSYYNSLRAMAVDDAGNVYVTGTSARFAPQLPERSWSDADFVTVLYDAAGKFRWSGRYNGPVNGIDGARDLAIDHFGNVYVTGLSDSAPLPDRPRPSDFKTRDYVTVKFGGESLATHFRHFRRGDSNANGELDSADPVANLAYQFLGEPVPCLDACDFDDSGRLEITDPIANLAHQFLGGPPPAPPGKEACGRDPTADELVCETFEACPRGG